MLALRRMTPNAFGTLMAVEPALAVILGLIVLQQTPAFLQIVGILIVVIAGAAAQRDGRRVPPPTPEREQEREAHHQ
jgi:inner membrane transporter RhtA